MSRLRRWWGHLLSARVDTTPLRTSRDFRVLFWGGAASYVGLFFSMVAVPYQIYDLTGSNLAVGLVGAVEILPMVLLGLYGGALADHVDRRKLIIICSVAHALLMGVLMVNAMLPTPSLPVIYAVAVLSVAAGALQRPSRDALLPRTVKHDEIPAAMALNAMTHQVGMLVVPSFAGVLLGLLGSAVCYAVGFGALVVAALLLVPLGRHDHLGETERPSLQGIVTGLRYAVRRKDLLGSYVVDFVGMLLAMPIVLFPALAEQVFAQPHLLGLLYSAEGVGALLASLTSGWTTRVHHHGRAITLAAIAWGAMIGLAGLMPSIWLALVFLALAGAFDTLSGLFRGTLWNQTIPDELRGRMAGIEMLSYTLGPLGAQVRSGVMGDLIGVRRAIAIGGALCVVGVAGTAAGLRSFWSYDNRTDPHALALRERRLAESEGEPVGP